MRQRFIVSLCILPLITSCAQNTSPSATGQSADAANALQPISASGDQSKIHTLPGGLKVVLVEEEKDATAQMLNVVAWSFRVSMPRPQTGLSCNVELLEKGKPAKTIATFSGSVSSTETRLTVGLDPVGQDISRSDKLKVFIAAREKGRSSNSSQIVGNPFSTTSFKGWQLFAEPQGDGSFLLMQGARNGVIGDIAETDVNLVCRLKLDERYSNETGNK